MTMYLLDANILSDMLRNPKGAAANTFRRKAADTDTQLMTSIVAACEMQYGVAKKGSDVLASRVKLLLASIEIAPLQPGVETEYAAVRVDLERKGQPIGPNDMLIAAHALALRAVLVTDNVREFKRVSGLRIQNWLRP